MKYNLQPIDEGRPQTLKLYAWDMAPFSIP